MEGISQVVVTLLLWIVLIVTRVAVEASWSSANRRLLSVSLVLMLASVVGLLIVV